MILTPNVSGFPQNDNDVSEPEWLINISQIQPYNSAVLGNNYLAFYTIHCVAICNIIISLIACCTVIISILFRLRKETWDFAIRFPFYLAIADFLWGISHLTDHMVLVTTKTYPGIASATGLSINLWFFLGYQQLMHAALAVYTYLKIVRGISINLGKGEWRLHALVFFIVALSVAFFYPLGSFGCSGYWFLQDVQTKAGLALGIYICTSGTIQALCTTVGYRSIKKAIEVQKLAMTNYLPGKYINKESHHSTATKCLATFVHISLCLYCPFALAYWVFVIESLFGVLEPFTQLFMVIVANSSGWANALGHFHNQRIKYKRTIKTTYNDNIPSMSTSSFTA